MTLSISPSDAAYDLSPTTPILVLGSAPEEDFDLSTLYIGVNNTPAFVNGSPVRPDFWARTVTAKGVLVVYLTARRAFLHRVKVEVVAQVSTDIALYGTTSQFEVRPPSVSLAVGIARRNLENRLSLPEEIGLNAVAQQLRSAIGGASVGAFFLRLLRRLRFSQLWSVVHPHVRSIEAELEAAFAAMIDDDVAIRGDFTPALGMIEVFWDPALDQFSQIGASPALTGLLDRCFRGSNDIERLAAAGTLIFLAQVVRPVGQEPLPIATLLSRGNF